MTMNGIIIIQTIIVPWNSEFSMMVAKKRQQTVHMLMLKMQLIIFWMLLLKYGALEWNSQKRIRLPMKRNPIFVLTLSRNMKAVVVTVKKMTKAKFAWPFLLAVGSSIY